MNGGLNIPQDPFLAAPASTKILGTIENSGNSLVQVWIENKGLILIIFAQLSGAVMGTGVKVLTTLPNPVPVLELMFIRMVITCVCCVVYMHFTNIMHPVWGPPGSRLLLVTRGVTSFFGLFGMYYSLQYLSLSDAIAITFLSPACVAVGGYLFLKEQLALKELGAGLVAILGVLFIARPEAIFGPSPTNPSAEKGTPVQRVIAVGVALIGVVGTAGAIIVLRFTGGRVHFMHSITYFAAWCSILSPIGTVIMGIEWIWPTDPKFMLGLLFISVVGFAGQVCLTTGMQNETAVKASIALYSQVVFSVMLELVFFHHVPQFLSILGITMIVAGALYVAISKKPSELSAQDNDHYTPLPPPEEGEDTRMHQTRFSDV